MKQGIYQITENTPLTSNVYRMRLIGDVSEITCPGQFINIKLDGLFLRRPISVYDYDESTVTIIYKVVGKGTDKLSAMSEGELDILTGLGNGYTISNDTSSALLLGG
jgi:dihydroorotate dehydrogenase electron transfer subunit